MRRNGGRGLTNPAFLVVQFGVDGHAQPVVAEGGAQLGGEEGGGRPGGLLRADQVQRLLQGDAGADTSIASNAHAPPISVLHRRARKRVTKH